MNMDITDSTFSFSEYCKEEPKQKDEKENVKIPEGCPKCGDRGKFIRMALCCPRHGMFAGC